ncbi:hypothetical protein PT974_00166 [Cladobotryum mycophilum]|uniref:DUF2293 domain-containing protein n=1 Tax=Cladobotryum mycophilum TaxID=491253 RepID=A0ABR0T0P2_9HYPO
MGRPRRNLPSVVASGPKERHKKAQRSQYDRQAPVPPGFVAKPPMPKSKHHSYFEFVENKDKKKKLEFEITTKKTPPPGFEFVPIGNPQLTTACKELSRTKDAMIFIVSNSKEKDATQLAYQVHRIGHHIRQAIVEEAKANIKNLPHHVVSTLDGEPEPIPTSQELYHAQADAAIRDLFPRIPNTDRQMIIEHAFTRGSTTKTEAPVGLSEDITLARRVQLAVLAHIRHNHTRYDVLLKETTWQNARKVVEALCLDILVKWRGDEETGRDQLDEILREVVVISDSEDDSSEEDLTDDTSVERSSTAGVVTISDSGPARGSSQADVGHHESPRSAAGINLPSTPAGISRRRNKETNRIRTADKKAQRGFKRYRAWEEAIRRNRDPSLMPHAAMDVNASHRQHQPHGPIAVSHDLPNGRYYESDSRIHPGAPGSTPGLNGYVPHQPMYTSAAWGPPQYASPNSLVPNSHEKVMSAALDQAPSTSSLRQPASPPGNRLQDMLVRSIEPVSPNARPSFVRTLPPRSPGQKDPTSPRSSLHHRPGPVSHFGERIFVEDRAHLSRGEIPGHPFQRDPLSGAFPNEPQSAQISHPRDYNPAHPINRGMPTSPLCLILWHAPMNLDRGGFYERINVRMERPIRDPSQQFQVIGPTPATQEIRRTFAPHRVVSWEEGSRILTESQGMAGVEVISISDPRPRIPSAGNRVANNPFNPQPQNGIFGGELRQGYREALSSSSRPVLGVEYAAAPPEGYWVVKRRDDRVIAPPQYHDTTYQRHHDERMHQHYHHPQLQNSPDVIVLD